MFPLSDIIVSSFQDCVITVPIFFNQAERRALVAAADIAGLNLLQVLIIQSGYPFRLLRIF